MGGKVVVAIGIIIIVKCLWGVLTFGTTLCLSLQRGYEAFNNNFQLNNLKRIWKMETSIEELDELLDEDMRVTSHKADRVEEDARQINIHKQILKAMKECV